jgi:hypothetical protein
VRVRLKKIYDFVSDLVSRDNSFLSFNMSSDYTKLPSFQSGFSAGSASGFSLKVNEVNQSVDVVVVNDSLSFLKGKNYVFRFARENRRPVISYLPDQQSLDPVNILANVPPLLRVYDPDEDILNITIVWYNGDTGFISPDPSTCPSASCNATITVVDPAGLKDSQIFRVYT